MLRPIVTACLSRRAIVVFALLMFIGAGLVAFRQLNIEAYPNPAPVILEVTAQAPGLSAEEMERYYTVPMEIGLYTTPGIDSIRSTSFYGLSFIRVTFKYGVDVNAAYAQTNVALQQNAQLPNSQIPQINQSSEVGEIFRYAVTGPKNFGLTNLRTVQDWIVLRRLAAIPGIVSINSWGGTTKQFSVEVDPRKLEAFNVTVPEILTALGNANINVGGREIRIGQQSINIRGIGQIDDGGGDNLLDGYKTGDIENTVLAQTGGVPVMIKDVAKVSVGAVPRLGIFGKDDKDDVVAAIVVMGQNQQTDKMLPKVRSAIDALNGDGSLPAGVKVVPFYDRGELIALTTHTVLHNLIFGCLLVFFIQWIFLGNLRSAIIVGMNIPFALFFSVILMVILGESANLLSISAIDFGVIVDSAVILVENIFRIFQKPKEERREFLRRLGEGHASGAGWSNRLRLILASALEVDKAIFFSTLITVAGFVPLFTMQGVEGQIFGPMARTYGYALAGALVATFSVTPVLASFLLPEHVEETETIVVRALRALYSPVLRFAVARRRLIVMIGVLFLLLVSLLAARLGSEFLPALEENNFWIRASMPATLSLEDGEAATHKMRRILMKHSEVVTVTSQHGRPDNGTDASPFSNVELFVPLKPPGEWPAGMTKEKLTEDIQAEFENELPGITFNFSQYIQDNVEEAISGVKGANSVKIVGSNLQMLEKLAAQVRDQMSQVSTLR